MLTNEEIKKIRKKMKKEHVFGAQLARQWNVTRQAVNCILNRSATSKNLENKLREWLNNE